VKIGKDLKTFADCSWFSVEIEQSLLLEWYQLKILFILVFV